MKVLILLGLCLEVLHFVDGAGRGLQQLVPTSFGQALPTSTQQTGTLFGQLTPQTTSGPGVPATQQTGLSFPGVLPVSQEAQLGSQVPTWTGQTTRPVLTTYPAATTYPTTNPTATNYPTTTPTVPTIYPTTTPAATTAYPATVPAAATAYPTTTPAVTTSYPTTTPAATTTYPTTTPAATTTNPTTTPAATTPAATTTSPRGTASTPTSTPTSPAPTSAAGSGSGCPDVDAVLQRHNYYRSQHGATPLTWNAQIAATAQSWSEGCVMQHSHNGYGENLAQGVSTCAAAVDLWMSEQSSYVPGSDFSASTGHFTQVVWAGSRELGCGFAAGCNLVTCNYSPAGNVIGLEKMCTES